MPIRVQLENDRILRLDVDPKAWKRAVERALESDRIVEVKNSRGQILAINPHQIQYWTQVPTGDPVEQAPAALAR